MTIEVTAKKVEEAISQGLAQLGATLDQVNVEVLESGGLFRKAKVRLTLQADESEKADNVVKSPDKTDKPQKPSKSDNSEKTEKAVRSENIDKTEKSANSEKNTKASVQKTASAEKSDGNREKGCKSDKTNKPIKPNKAHKETAGAASVKTEKEPQQPRVRTEEDKAAFARAVEFVKEVVVKMGFDGVDISADEKNEIVSITAPAGDDSLIIGRHGETLSALSYIAETCARAEKCHINVTVDCNGYRDRRAQSLTAMARRRADECVNKHRRIKLEPMERIDRRTIHNALTGDNRVTTASEGKEPYRYIVIAPKK